MTATGASSVKMLVLAVYSRCGFRRLLAAGGSDSRSRPVWLRCGSRRLFVAGWFDWLLQHSAVAMWC